MPHDTVAADNSTIKTVHTLGQLHYGVSDREPQGDWF
jgi:hypothetical protein